MPEHAKETAMKRLVLVLALLVVGTLPAHADPEANKKAVLDFYDKALNQKDFDAAVEISRTALHPAQSRRA